MFRSILVFSPKLAEFCQDTGKSHNSIQMLYKCTTTWLVKPGQAADSLRYPQYYGRCLIKCMSRENKEQLPTFQLLCYKILTLAQMVFITILYLTDLKQFNRFGQSLSSHQLSIVSILSAVRSFDPVFPSPLLVWVSAPVGGSSAG